MTIKPLPRGKSAAPRFERVLVFDDPVMTRELFGPENAGLAALAKAAGVEAADRGSRVVLVGPSKAQVDLAADTLLAFYALVKDGTPPSPRDLVFGYDLLAKDPGADLAALFKDAVFAASPKTLVTPKTAKQKEYIEAIRGHDVVFGVGPAGTGKTWLAAAAAVQALLARRVKRLILTRPAVEAGERLGFLPGDLAEKINPYLRPLYDALNDLLDFGKVREMIAQGVIEIAPLAFMRGRTLNDAFILLDEAQNTTPEQMKMFLTRMGFNSKVVVTGDVTQIDLPHPPEGRERSGLVEAVKILDGVDGLRFVRFGREDVIRHPLVARIVNAYESA